MEQVAEAPAINGSPGLIAWLCQQCGAADSVLIYTRAQKGPENSGHSAF
jgi:hypothetical protein